MMMSSSPSGITKKWRVPMAVKLSLQPGLGRMPGWGLLGLEVRPSASASMALDSTSLVSACWYKTIAMGETGEGERDATSLMKAGMTGAV